MLAVVQWPPAGQIFEKWHLEKARAEKPCKTPPPEFQTEPYGASYGRKPFGGGQAGSGAHFPTKCAENLVFYTLSEPPGDLKTLATLAILAILVWKWCKTGCSDPEVSAPEARMTVVQPTPSNQHRPPKGG